MAKTHTPPNHPTPTPAAASPPVPIPPYTAREREEIGARFAAALVAALIVRDAGGYPADDAMAFLRQTIKPTAEPNAPAITVIEAFGGGGVIATGVDKAIVAAGCRPHHLAVAEWMDAPAAAYAANIGAGIRRYRDVWSIADGELGSAERTPAERELLRLTRRAAGRGDAVDVLVGGPPCQPYSKARRKPTGEDGERQDAGKLLSQVRLYGRMIRLAQVLRPKMVIVENADSCIEHPWVRRYLTSLRDDSGYRLSMAVLDAADFGAAQQRLRFVVVGVRGDLGQKFDYRAMLATYGTRRHGAMEAIWDLNEDPTKPETMGTRIDGAGVLAQRTAWINGATMFQPLPPHLLNGSLIKRKGRPYGGTYQRMQPDWPAMALTRNFRSPAHGEYLHPTINRGLSLREGMRLQGLPDYYRLPTGLSEDEAELIVGNGAPPQYAMAILGQAFAQGILTASPATTSFRDLSAILASGLAARSMGAPSVVALAAAASASGTDEDRVDEADIRRAACGQRMAGFRGLCRVLGVLGYEIAWTDAASAAGDREALAERIAEVISGRCRTEAEVVRLAERAGVDRDVVAGWCGRTTRPMRGPRRPLTLAERGHRFRTLSAVGQALGVALVLRPVPDAAGRAEARRKAVEAIARWNPLPATSLARAGSAA